MKRTYTCRLIKSFCHRRHVFGLGACKRIMEMEPFGSDNPFPVFLCRDVKVTNKLILKDKHLKLKLDNGVDAIGFNMVDMEKYAEGKIDIVF